MQSLTAPIFSAQQHCSFNWFGAGRGSCDGSCLLCDAVATCISAKCVYAETVVTGSRVAQSPSALAPDNTISPVNVMFDAECLCVARLQGYGRIGHNVQADEFAPKRLEALTQRVKAASDAKVLPLYAEHVHTALCMRLQKSRLHLTPRCRHLSASPLSRAWAPPVHDTLYVIPTGQLLMLSVRLQAPSSRPLQPSLECGRSANALPLKGHRGHLPLCSLLQACPQVACGSTSSFCTTNISGQLYAWGKLKVSGDNIMCALSLSLVTGDASPGAAGTGPRLFMCTMRHQELRTLPLGVTQVPAHL